MLIWVWGARELLERPEAGCMSREQLTASFLQEEVPEDRKPVMDAIAASPLSLEKRAPRLHVMIADAPCGLF